MKSRFTYRLRPIDAAILTGILKRAHPSTSTVTTAADEWPERWKFLARSSSTASGDFINRPGAGTELPSASQHELIHATNRGILVVLTRPTGLYLDARFANSGYHPVPVALGRY